MEPSKDRLEAFIDGQLSVTEMQEMESLLANRPDLAAYVERQSRLRARLAEAFAPVIDEAIPQHLRDAVASSPVSARFRAAAWLRAAAPVLPRLAIPAAALACGLVLGIWFRAPSDFQTSSGGQVLAQGELAAALTDRLASAGTPKTGARIGVSFRDRGGRNCRSFQVPGQGASTAGVACREGSDWVVAVLAAGSSQTPGAYQQAGAEMPPVVRGTISSMIEGKPFDAAAERAARDRGWKPN